MVKHAFEFGQMSRCQTTIQTVMPEGGEIDQLCRDVFERPDNNRRQD